MPLLLLDLDNTLVNRASAFRNWARGFTAVHGGDVDDCATAIEYVVATGR